MSELELPADMDGTEVAIERASVLSSDHEMDAGSRLAMGSGVASLLVGMPSISLADIGATCFNGEALMVLDDFLKWRWNPLPPPPVCTGAAMLPLDAWRADGVELFWWKSGGGGVAVAVRDII